MNKRKLFTISKILISGLISATGLYGQSSSSQVSIVDVPMTTVVGYSPMITSESTFTKLIDTTNNSRIVYFTYHFQPIQHYYYNYLDRKITEKQFGQYLSYYKQSEATLTKQRINESITIKCQFTKDRYINIIPDQNNDGNFTNDPIFRIREKKQSSESVRSENNLPFFKIDNIEYYDNNLIRRRSAYMRMLLFTDPKTGEETDSIDINNITFQCFEHRHGTLSIDNARYNIFLNSPVFQQDYKNRVHIYISPIDKPVPANTVAVDIQLRDTLSDKHYIISPLNVSEFGDTLRLWIQKNTGNYFGFQQGEKVPRLSYNDITNNKINLYSQNDQEFLLLDFFGSWCAPCIANLPHIKELQKELGSSLRIVGIAYERDSSLEKLTSIINMEKITWPIVLQQKTKDYTIITRARVRFYPTYLLISPHGNVVFRGIGQKSDFNTIRSIIQAYKNK